MLGIVMMLVSAVCRAFDISYMKLLNKVKSVETKVSLFSRRRYIITVEENGDIQYAPMAYEVNPTSLDQLTVLFYLSLVGTLVSSICFGA